MDVKKQLSILFNSSVNELDKEQIVTVERGETTVSSYLYLLDYLNVSVDYITVAFNYNLLDNNDLLNIIDSVKNINGEPILFSTIQNSFETVTNLDDTFRTVHFYCCGQLYLLIQRINYFWTGKIRCFAVDSPMELSPEIF